MREIISPSAAIIDAGLGKIVLLFTDGRFFGGTHVIMVGHVEPEVAVSGPIGLVREGNMILLEPRKPEMFVQVSDEEMERRSKRVK